MVKACSVLSSQKFPLVPEIVRHVCFQTLAGAPPDLVESATVTEPFLTPILRFVVVPSFPTNKSSLLGPFPKSNTLFQLRVMDELIANHPQTDMVLGRVNAGNWKNCKLVPVNQALFELAPNGPDAWAVGEDAEAISEPVTPDVSRNSSP
jgi:hypothetical protein